MVSYEGDFNSNIFKNPQPMFSLLAKYRFNPRMALAMNISYGKLKGSAKDVSSYVPEKWANYDFTRKIGDVGLRLEWNFWPFGTGMEYRGAQRLTPYIFLGLGTTVYKTDKAQLTMNMPIFAVTGSLKSFDLIYVLTNGGPVHATEVPSTLMINLLFLRNRYGMGSTIAVMLIILCFVFALIINMIFRKEKVV